MKVILDKSRAVGALDTLVQNAGFDNHAMGLFAAQTWHRLYTPYVPMRTGVLATNVTLEPWKITHNCPYAKYTYNGNFKFRKDHHARATRQWDQAAIRAGKTEKLTNSLQKYILSGRASV